MRVALDKLYLWCGYLAAIFLAGIGVLMLAQVAGRELGLQVRGADDLTAWFCAASAFLPLAHTFKQGELVRVGLLIENLTESRRYWAELLSLSVASLATAYMSWAAFIFVVQSYQFDEKAQGLLQIPIWIPQCSFVLGALMLAIACLDELVTLLRGGKPAYRLAHEERMRRGEFGEGV